MSIRNGFVKKLVFAGLLFCLITLTLGSANAKFSYPISMITIVNPMSAGGMTEVRLRTLGQFLQDELKDVKIIVDTRPGGGSAVGIGYALRQPADGSFMFGYTQPHLSIACVRGAPFKIDEVMPLLTFDSENMALFVHKSSPFKNFTDFYKYAKKNPGKLSVAYHAGGADDMLANYFSATLGFKLRMVPYDGGAPARQALAGKHVDLLISPIYSAWREYPDEYRILTIFSDTPYKEKDFVKVPIIEEALKKADPGFVMPKDLTLFNNYNFVGVSKAFVEKYPDRFDILVKATEKILTSKEFIELAGKRNFYPKYQGPEKSLEITQWWDRIIQENKEQFL